MAFLKMEQPTDNSIINNLTSLSNWLHSNSSWFPFEDERREQIDESAFWIFCSSSETTLSLSTTLSLFINKREEKKWIIATTTRHYDLNKQSTYEEWIEIVVLKQQLEQLYFGNKYHYSYSVE